MRIDKLRLKNFKGFEDTTLEFHPQLNLIVGENGSGKTSVLEALTVAMGGFLLGIKDISQQDQRYIHPEEVRLLTMPSGGAELQFPSRVEVQGEVGRAPIAWLQEKVKRSGRARTIGSKPVREKAEALDAQVRQGQPVNLPVLVYYSTDRLRKDFIEKAEAKKNIPSRFRGYQSCLQTTSTFKVFQQWFKQKELSALQKKEESISLELVKTRIAQFVPRCKNVFYEHDPDQVEGLKIVTTDGQTLPFEYLSDGTRHFFALIADLSYRCVTLNPHLGMGATEQTDGIVLIDELDLHLHPLWQKKSLSALREAFPKVQFFITTHSPFLIQETGDGELLRLQDNQGDNGEGAEMSLEDIAEELQGIKNPQWSHKRQVLFDAAKAYYQALQQGESPERTDALKQAFSEASAWFSANPVYQAIMEQERLLNEKP